VAAVSFAGCGKVPSKGEAGGAAGPEAALSVYVVNYPLMYFAERIGGEAVDVRFPVPGDEDPAYWSPGAEDVGAYQEADLVLLNGAGYAGWVSKVSLPSARMVDTGKPLADRFIEIEEHVTHTHGPEGKHAHGGLAFTTWLDPALAVEQARAVKDALAVRRATQGSRFEERFKLLEKDLRALDQRMETMVAGNREQPLVFSHPVYQYFHRRYRLNGKSVHWEPDEIPDEEKLAGLKELLATHPARWMVWEAPPLPETIVKLEEMGVRSVVFDPCGNVPERGDYLDVMRRNAENLASVFEGP
jgi:zinc transport system substrate-binding protein